MELKLYKSFTKTISVCTQVEDVVELLLCALRDDDTVVRWSAAKGVGRIGARLPALAAAEVCECVLALFAHNERETAWHGGCMALAELGQWVLGMFPLPLPIREGGRRIEPCITTGPIRARWYA